MNMNNQEYNPPVDQLLTLGETRLLDQDKWTDYLALGIGSQDIPELIRMATDEELNNASSDSLEVWAPIHALRALGELRAEEAIAPLVAYFEGHEGDEYMMEDIPRALGKIGPAAIPAISSFIADDSHDQFERAFAANSLPEIGKEHPEARAECIAALVKQLELYEQNDEEWNASIISDLARMKAIEELPLIERAFAADRVDESFIDLEDVLVEMGLKEYEPPPPLTFSELEKLFPTPPTRHYKPSDFQIVTPTTTMPVVQGKPIKFSRKKPKKKRRK